MAALPSLVLKGLLEGLVLLAIEREPTHGYGILKDLEAILGEGPTKGQVYPLLQRLEDDGLIVSREVDDDGRAKQVYRLTSAGQGRLGEYRELSVAFKHQLVDLFDIPSHQDLAGQLEAGGHVEELEAMDRGPPELARTPVSSAPAPAAEEGWVIEHLEGLPRGPEIKAPHARVSMDREPGTGTWILTVERHDPAAYDQAEACPLTYLYLATQRLLFEPPDQGT